MRIPLGLLLAVLVLRAEPAQAAGLAASWDYPVDPAGITFTLTILPATSGTPQTMTVTGATSLTMPCPAPDTYTFWLQAKQGSQQSDPSNILTCQIITATPCDCTTLDNTIQSHAPDAATVLAALQTQAPPDPTPTPPIAPAVAAPPVAALQPISAGGTNLILAWNYPRDSASTPARFLVSYATTATVPASPALFAVPIHDVSACATAPGVDANTWCSRLQCPGPGDWTFWVQADTGTRLAEASNHISCTIADTNLPCTCTPSRATAAPPLATPIAPLPVTTSASASAAPTQAVRPAPLPAPTQPVHHQRRRHHHGHHRARR